VGDEGSDHIDGTAGPSYPQSGAKRSTTKGEPVSDAPVNVETGADGSLIVQPHGDVDADRAVELRQILVHAVRHVRPLRLIVDLRDVSGIDPINLGTLAAVCDLADDHHVAVFLDDSSPEISEQLAGAGVPRQRLRRTTDHDQTPIASDR
jgi:anti-anti-sigma factor